MKASKRLRELMIAGEPISSDDVTDEALIAVVELAEHQLPHSDLDALRRALGVSE